MAELAITHGLGVDEHSRDEPRASDRLTDAFRTEELAGLRLAALGRVASLTVISVLLFFQLPTPEVFYYEALLAVFVAIGIAYYVLRRSWLGRPWQGYLFVALDFAILTYALIVPNPLCGCEYPPQLALREGTFVYYFLFVAAVAFSYSPRLMLWAGLAGALSWSVGVIWLLSLPDTLSGHSTLFDSGFVEERLDPRFVDHHVWVPQVVVLLLVAHCLAGVVWRSRRLVIRQAKATRERENLARYFPPSIVDRLAALDEPLGAVRAQPVAVLFADIVGFSRLAEEEEPAQVVGLLREFHSRMERAIFDHDGTLDKFLGDGVMATFGTPNTGPRDAANALACARAMLATTEEWNRERVAEGQPAIQLSIGIHYGDVVIGDIGSERRLEFAVLGDTVNVASRLESITRDLDCTVAVSDELVRAVRNEIYDEADALLANFRKVNPQALRGRNTRIAVWILATEQGWR